MSENAPLSHSAIERLPVELMGEIIARLPNLRSLQMAVLSCPAFHQAFAGANMVLYTRVALNQINPGVLPEATAALESSQLLTQPASSHHQSLADFVDRHLRQRLERMPSWDFRQALLMERLGSLVSALAKQFAEAALLEKFAATKGMPPNTSHVECAPPTPSELCRFERALYRFEMYCNLSRITKGEMGYQAKQMKLLFDNFSPWENEQLACVHDFLFRLVSPAYNDLAEHDILWGLRDVMYPARSHDDRFASVLLLGLEKLHQISIAATYEQRCELMGFDTAPPVQHINLNDVLFFSYPGIQDDRVLSELNLEDARSVLPSPLYADPDPGPTDVWWWTHLEDPPSMWVMSGDHRYLRKEAYVMWDRSRLDKLDIFHQQWDDQDVGQFTPYSESSMPEIFESFEARRRIFYEGGRGWWKPGDLSRIRWTGKRTDSPSA